MLSAMKKGMTGRLRAASRVILIACRSLHIEKFHLLNKINAIRHELVPPVCNKMLFAGGIKLMAVGGPNQREDYHVEMGEELFWQLEGPMNVAIVNPKSQKRENISIKENDIYILPALVPHSPQRYAKTIGLVFERVRYPSELDCLRWYFNAPQSDGLKLMYQSTFYCHDLGTQVKDAIESFRSQRSSLANKRAAYNIAEDQKAVELREFEIKAKDAISIEAPRAYSSLLNNDSSIHSKEFQLQRLSGFKSYSLQFPQSIPEIVLWQKKGSAQLKFLGKDVGELLEGEICIVINNPQNSQDRNNLDIYHKSNTEVTISIVNNVSFAVYN